MKPILLAIFACLTSLASGQSTNAPSAPAPDGSTQVPVTFTGGYDTDPRDHGRPVILVASALNVPPEVFRKVFTGVHPAPGGEQPQPDEVRKNKEVLLAGLGPYGVTNDRLDEVSNYYRYRRGAGEMWKHVDATAYATVSNGAVTGITITNPGAGYSSPPTVTVPGFDKVSLTATLFFGTDLATNGSIKEITINK